MRNSGCIEMSRSIAHYREKPRLKLRTVKNANLNEWQLLQLVKETSMYFDI